MAITENLKKILAAVYGRDVRQSIHDSIQECYNNAEACKSYTNEHVKDMETKMAGITGQSKALMAKTRKDVRNVQAIFSVEKTVSITDGKLWEAQDAGSSCVLMEGAKTQCTTLNVQRGERYVLCGNMKDGDDKHQIKLISMNTPITTLKNRFLHDKGKFWEIPDKVLNLRTSMNVIIYDKTVYFLDMSGETLFNMERAYKIKCTEAVNEIEKLKIISDSEMFRSTATSGQNPRRFAAFSKSKLQLLTKKKNREKAAKYFKIPLTDDKQFDTSQKVDAENLVKVLCGKAMWDVLEEVPVEVDGSKDWVS